MRKVLKETEIEKTIGFFVTFQSLVTFQLKGGTLPPLATPMIPAGVIYEIIVVENA